MTRYFFHIHRGGVSHIDREGVELADDPAAWGQGVMAFGEMLRDADGRLVAGDQWRMEIETEDGKSLFTFQFEANAH
jgi:hypothetical protein